MKIIQLFIFSSSVGSNQKKCKGNPWIPAFAGMTAICGYGFAWTGRDLSLQTLYLQGALFGLFQQP